MKVFIKQLAVLWFWGNIGKEWHGGLCTISISGTYGLFTCIETSDFGGASHLREILFITVKLHAHFQYQSINVIFVVFRNF